jgi:hypothetical protein
MKKLLLTLTMLLLSTQAFARTTFTTYDVVDEDDMIIGEMTVEDNGRQKLQHWVIYPDPDKLTKDSNRYPNPDFFPNPDVRQSELHLERSDDGYTSRRELLASIQSGERYFQIKSGASVSIAPLPSP